MQVFKYSTTIRTICRSVPDSVFQSLVVSLVLNRLDFGNATFAGLPAHQYRRLQSVLNAAARLIYRRRRFDHVTQKRDLHWLKVPERVAYKLAVTVYRCLHGMAPPYLCNGLQHVAELNRRLLHSSMFNALVFPSTRLVTVGDRAFLVAGSRLWNSLPTDVTSATTLPIFCSGLKTYLFSVSFPA